VRKTAPNVPSESKTVHEGVKTLTVPGAKNVVLSGEQSLAGIRKHTKRRKMILSP